MPIVLSACTNLLSNTYATYTLPDYAGFDQHDSCEFAEWLLDALHENLEVRRDNGMIDLSGNATSSAGTAATVRDYWLQLKEKSPVYDHFCGLLQSTSRCASCRLSSPEKFDPFLTIQVPLPRLLPGTTSIQLTNALTLYSTLESVKVLNSARCTRCGSTAIHKRLQLAAEFLPQQLILQLNRFSASSATTFVKNSTVVDFPLDGLDISPLVNGTTSQGAVYDCVAMSNHFSSSSDDIKGGGSGHYTAYARHGSAAPWYHYNDNVVTAVDDEPNKANAYVLFFSRRSQAQPISHATPPSASHASDHHVNMTDDN